MKIKKLAIMGAVLIAVGAMTIVIAARARAVDRDPLQDLETAGQALKERQGPADGGPLDSPSAKQSTKSLTVVYYVGDILGVNSLPPQIRSDGSQRKYSEAELRGVVDMTPVIDLIAETLAPERSRANERDNIKPSNSLVVTPFYLSLSLIIRCDDNGHKKINQLLHGLRVRCPATPAEPARR
jgi:hypothetical protein